MAESKIDLNLDTFHPDAVSQDKGSFSLIKSMVRPVLAEFVGMTILVFLVNLVPMQGAQTFGVIYGIVMVFLTASFANTDFSVGYFNPAITVGRVLSGQLPIILSIGYFVAQILGGIAGAAICRGLYTSNKDLYGELFTTLITGHYGYDSTAEYIGRTIAAAALMTLVVVLTALTTLDNERISHLAPLCIGLSVGVCYIAGYLVRGGLMNPAMNFGLNVANSAFDGGALWGYHYIDWVGPLLGAILATILFRLLFAKEKRSIRLWKI